MCISLPPRQLVTRWGDVTAAHPRASHRPERRSAGCVRYRAQATGQMTRASGGCQSKPTGSAGPGHMPPQTHYRDDRTTQVQVQIHSRRPGSSVGGRTARHVWTETAQHTASVAVMEDVPLQLLTVHMSADCSLTAILYGPYVCSLTAALNGPCLQLSYICFTDRASQVGFRGPGQTDRRKMPLICFLCKTC